MRKNIFLKVLFEKRRSIFLWMTAVLVSNVALALLFPAIRDTMAAAISSVPPSMESWFGDAQTWQTYTGYAGQQLFGQMTIILVIMAILFGANFLAGYEGSGTLLTLLSRPVSRRKVYWQKYVAFVVALAEVSFAFYAGAVIGGWVLGENVEYVVFAECMLMAFLLCLALGSVAYAVGAITGRSGIAGTIVGFYALVAYLVASLSTATEVVDKLSYGSLFRYSAAPDVIASGLDPGHIVILLLVAIVPVSLAWLVFERRDLRTR